MLLSCLLRNWNHCSAAARRRTQTSSRRRTGSRTQLEALENRWLFSTLTVTSANDSGAGSLRDAIAAAQSGDTIAFDAGLAGQAISLTGGELAINKSLTIHG